MITEEETWLYTFKDTGISLRSPVPPEVAETLDGIDWDILFTWDQRPHYTQEQIASAVGIPFGEYCHRLPRLIDIGLIRKVGGC